MSCRACLLSCALLYAGSLYSWAVSPTNITLNAKSKKQGFIEMRNTEDREIPVEIHVARRFVDEEGNDRLERDDRGDFVVYPEHVVLKPKDTRMVRIIWKGKRKLDYEESYRLVFNEQTVSLPKNIEDLDTQEDAKAGVSLTFTMRYIIALYMAPHEKTKPQLVVEEHKFVKEGDATYLECLVNNTGTKHAPINVVTSEIVASYNKEGKKQEFTIPEETLIESFKKDNINILAQHKRRLRFKWSDGFPSDVISVNVID